MKPASSISGRPTTPPPTRCARDPGARCLHGRRRHSWPWHGPSEQLRIPELHSPSFAASTSCASESAIAHQTDDNVAPSNFNGMLRFRRSSSYRRRSELPGGGARSSRSARATPPSRLLSPTKESSSATTGECGPTLRSTWAFATRLKPIFTIIAISRRASRSPGRRAKTVIRARGRHVLRSLRACQHSDRRPL